MNKSEFADVVDSQLSYCREILYRRANLYSEGDDRLANFKKAAHLQGASPIIALFGMLSKHLVCLSDLVTSAAVSEDQWKETITDSINYLLLLRALIKEERK